MLYFSERTRFTETGQMIHTESVVTNENRDHAIPTAQSVRAGDTTLGSADDVTPTSRIISTGTDARSACTSQITNKRRGSFKQCRLCPRLFVRCDKLTEHEKKNHDDMHHVCKCGAKFELMKTLQSHLYDTGPPDHGFQQPTMVSPTHGQQQQPKRRDRPRHSAGKHLVKKAILPMNALARRDPYSAMVYGAHEARKRKWHQSCDRCGRAFRPGTGLARHLIDHESDSAMYRCQFPAYRSSDGRRCNFEYAAAELISFKKHVRNHHDLIVASWQEATDLAASAAVLGTSVAARQQESINLSSPLPPAVAEPAVAMAKASSVGSGSGHKIASKFPDLFTAFGKSAKRKNC